MEEVEEVKENQLMRFEHFEGRGCYGNVRIAEETAT